MTIKASTHNDQYWPNINQYVMRWLHAGLEVISLRARVNKLLCVVSEDPSLHRVPAPEPQRAAFLPAAQECKLYFGVQLWTSSRNAMCFHCGVLSLRRNMFQKKKKKREVINKDEVLLALVGWQLAPEQKNMLEGLEGFRFRGFCVFW